MIVGAITHGPSYEQSSIFALLSKELRAPRPANGKPEIPLCRTEFAIKFPITITILEYTAANEHVLIVIKNHFIAELLQRIDIRIRTTL